MIREKIRDYIILLNDTHGIKLDAIAERTNLGIDRIKRLKYNKIKNPGQHELNAIEDAYGHLLSEPSDINDVPSHTAGEFRDLQKRVEVLENLVYMNKKIMDKLDLIERLVLNMKENP